MPGNNTRIASPTVLAWLMAVFVPLIVGSTLLSRAYEMRRPDTVEAVNHIHLPTGVADAKDGVLFALEPAESGTVIVNPKPLAPVSAQGDPISVLENGRAVLIGRYFYRFTSTPPRLKWELVGARLRLNESVGRSPAFERTSALVYEPKPEVGQELAVWIDGIPSRAFTPRTATDCGLSGEAACLEIHSAGRITLERASESPKFHHPHVGEKIGVRPADWLWIASFPYRLLPVRGGKEIDLVLAENAVTLHGSRSGLGSPGLNGIAELGDANVFQVEDITAQFREKHLAGRRWEPETEDEMQLLIDSGLLCIAYTREDGRIVPQIQWTNLSAGECRDPLGIAEPQHAIGVSDSVLAVYIRRRQNDQLIRRVNERLRELPSTNPGDFPFVFEWWPVSTPSGIIKLPVRIWGVRTGSTLRNLTARSGLSTQAEDPLARAVVLQSRTGITTVLARDVAGERIYASAYAMLGLGPLIGIKDSVDGLDGVVATGRNAKRVTLTIDPDLQSALWTSLKANLGTIGSSPPTFRQSPSFGISGVVLDAENGDVLSVLNWPSALMWENPALYAELERGGVWGVPQPSLNGAMLRADKVGSVFKIMAIYSMADSGVLDPEHGIAGTSCARSPFGAMATRNGRVSVIASPFEDHQEGPMPVGPSGLLGGLDHATATSCNTYFALATTMLLDSHPPELHQVRACPIDAHMRRTDAGRPTSKEWLLCSADLGGGRKKGAKGGSTHWLLLPEGENLAERSRRAFTDPAHYGGYFARLIEAGFRLGYPEEVKVNSNGGAGNGGASFVRMAGHSRLSYENVKYRQDWMLNIPRAEGHVFLYPSVFSPRSFFGGGGEQWDGTVQQIRGTFSWRDFAAQAIGEAGQGSALSVATMYTAVGRDDGSIPSPRLVPSDTISLQKVFDPKGRRVDRIRQALRQPLLPPRGTAREVGAFLNKNGIGSVFGKTGTFVIESADTEPASDDADDRNAEPASAGCGVVPLERLLVPNRSTAPDLLGSPYCEKGRLMATAVHRYPENPSTFAGAARRQTRGEIRKATHTTFAAVLMPRKAGAHPIVAALIVDLDEYSGQHINARRMIEPLLKEISAWMH